MSFKQTLENRELPMSNKLQSHCPIEELIAEITWRTRSNRLSVCAIYSDCSQTITLSAIVCEEDKDSPRDADLADANAAIPAGSGDAAGGYEDFSEDGADDDYEED